ncbi:unnamed protein product [Caenorhabditis auriculariae]|uniref:Uncharacterized protein n=1 Tax=Caenorhabditis auriculariae TaxID=2777116 RepID=A0A8S1HYU6_9PELO|nr:unnamed protein product [Caenorhabditis auriculariae]
MVGKVSSQFCSEKIAPHQPRNSTPFKITTCLRKGQDETSEKESRRRPHPAPEADPAPRRMVLMAHDPLRWRYRTPPRRQDQDEDVEDDEEEAEVERESISGGSDSGAQEEEEEARPVRAAPAPLRRFSRPLLISHDPMRVYYRGKQ